MKSINQHITLLLVTLLMIVSAGVVSAAPITVKASLDSTYLLMGKQTRLQVDIVQNEGVQGYFINHNGDTITREIEIIERLKPDTSSLGSGREEIRHSIVIQSFDSGVYTIKPFVYVAGHDTVLSNALALKVLPVPVDTLTTIHDYAPVASADYLWYDYLPDWITDYWWIYVIILAVAGIVLLYFLVFKKKVIAPLMPKKKPVPPYEMAVQQLTRLKDEKLCERGQEKEYYTRLTEILRVYLDRRFGINAMEMTSSQILSTLQHRDDTKEPNKLMRRILEVADFVKFAGVRPMPDDNVRSMTMAMQFVEDTKPAEPTPTDEAADQTAPTTNANPKDTEK